MFRIIFIAALIFSYGVMADEGAPTPLDAPEPPGKIESGEPMEPDVTIIRKDGESVEEYRRNNRVYKVKVTPVIGPPYYLEDSDGDGNLDVRHSDNERGMKVNQWELFSW